MINASRTIVFAIIVSAISCLFAATPEIQQAIELWNSGKTEEAFPILLKYKDSDDADALAYLGMGYLSGDGVAKNASLAFEYFNKAAAQKQPYGLNGLGICHLYGDGAKQDLQKAEIAFKQAAEANCPYAEFNLGTLYEGSVQVAEDTPIILDYGNAKKALGHFHRSYDAGNLKPECAEHIGILLLGGETPKEAIRWLHEAADGNQITAILVLAHQYEIGGLVSMNRNAAIDYAEKFGSLTKDYSVYSGICYRTGIEYLCLKQRREALMFLQMAADAGDVDAQYQMAMSHQDNSVRCKYALMAVKNGNRQVLVSAGTYLATQKQYEEAMKTYLEAVKDGSLDAMCEIAIMHRLGEGVPADYEKSMEWYAKAAKRYHPRALRELGVKHYIKYQEDPQKESYKTIPPELSKAYALMAMAVKACDGPASEKLPAFPFFDRLHEIVPSDSDMELAKGLVNLLYGKGKTDIDDGFKLLEASIAHGNVDAMNTLASIYSHDGPHKNLGRAAELYKMAAAKGSVFAAEALCNTIFSTVLGEDEYIGILKSQADKNYGVALFNLAINYAKKGDVQKAGELLLRNARNGDSHSMSQLYFDMCQKKKLPCSEEEITALHSKALAKHDGFLEYNYATLRFLADDMDSYRTFLIRAWLDGCREPGIYMDLAMLFLHGTNVKRDSAFAVEMFEDGIQNGNWDYCLTLGVLLAKGNDGVVKDEERAMELFRQGAEHGVNGCKEKLEELQAEIAKQK